MAAATERPRRWQLFDSIADRAMHVIVFACIWVLFSVVGLLVIGFRSPSLKHWLIAIAAFPFIYLAFEAVAEIVRRMPPFCKTRKSVEEAAKEKAFSGLRLAYLFVETLVLLSVSIAVWHFGKAVVQKWFP